MVFLHFGYRNGAKKQVIWTTCCKVMVKMTKSGLYPVSANLDYIGFSKGKSKMKIVWQTIYIGNFLVRTINVCKCRNTPKIYLCISEKNVFFGTKFFWGHSGKQFPESPVSQLQKGVSNNKQQCLGMNKLRRL